jgi:hypothetical protein
VKPGQGYIVTFDLAIYSALWAGWGVEPLCVEASRVIWAAARLLSVIGYRLFGFPFFLINIKK